VKITVGNSRARISDFESDEEYKFAADALLYTTDVFNPAKRRMMKTVASMLNVRDNSFPVGCAPLLKTMAKEAGYTVTVVNERVRPGGPPNLAIFDLLMRTPRNFQREAAAAVLKQGIGIVKASTGSGKTLAIVMILAATQDIRWVVFCPKDTLAKQMAKEYEYNLQEKCGIIVDGCWNPQRVTIVTFSQCRAKPDLIRPILEQADGVICDEVHGSGAETHSHFIQMCTNAFYRAGMSATPLDRSDRKTLLAIASLGPLIYEISSNELVELGLIAKPHIRMVSYQQEQDYPLARGLSEPAAIYRARVVKNKDRNALLVKMIELAPKPLFCFCTRNEHVTAVYEAVKKLGYLSVDTADQKVSQDKRESILSRMRSGLLDVCITSAVFQEGSDVPNLASVVVGTGYKATIAALQRLGRGSRIGPDGSKKTFELWDLADEGAWGSYHTEARHKIYEREGYEVETVSHAAVELMYAERVSY